VWLAQAHEEVPASTPVEWRRRWATEAAAYDQAPLPEVMLDPEGTAPPEPDGFGRRNADTVEASLEQALTLLASKS
jgi:hypothetical protein